MLYLVYILAGAGAGVVTGLAGLSDDPSGGKCAGEILFTFTCQCM